MQNWIRFCLLSVVPFISVFILLQKKENWSQWSKVLKENANFLKMLVMKCKKSIKTSQATSKTGTIKNKQRRLIEKLNFFVKENNLPADNFIYWSAINFPTKKFLHLRFARNVWDKTVFVGWTRSRISILLLWRKPVVLTSRHITF